MFNAQMSDLLRRECAYQERTLFARNAFTQEGPMTGPNDYQYFITDNRGTKLSGTGNHREDRALATAESMAKASPGTAYYVVKAIAVAKAPVPPPPPSIITRL
jgi:hypothetical protein